MRKLVVFCGVLGGAFVAPALAGRPSNSPDQPSYHHAMVEKLRAVVAKVPEENTWHGDRRARELRAQLKRESRRLPPAALLQLYRELAEQELRLGDTEAAIRNLKQAIKLMPGLLRLQAADRRAVKFELAIAYLRQAEDENCIQDHCASSCLFPIGEDGQHRFPESTELAYRTLLEILQEDPEDSEARWLLNVTAMTLGKYPNGMPAELRIDAKTFASDVDFPRFSEVATDLGVSTMSLGGRRDHGGF